MINWSWVVKFVVIHITRKIRGSKFWDRIKVWLISDYDDIIINWNTNKGIKIVKLENLNNNNYHSIS